MSSRSIRLKFTLHAAPQSWFKALQCPLTLPLKLTLLLSSFSLGLNRSGSLLNSPIPLAQKPNVAGVLGIAKCKEKAPEQQGNGPRVGCDTHFYGRRATFFALKLFGGCVSIEQNL